MRQLPPGAAGEGARNSLTKIFYDYDHKSDSDYLLNERKVAYSFYYCQHV